VCCHLGRAFFAAAGAVIEVRAIRQAKNTTAKGAAERSTEYSYFLLVCQSGIQTADRKPNCSDFLQEQASIQETLTRF